ncbi:ADP-ribosylglycohydrolase family protein [Paenarthrobacter sp. Z7-10]|uniref:ADP-ribosylglycohydrolase family protein n=1 Tax=Paenarthrobacter sp. Z7-10 TaxID=2787635 RepID=UPI0022A95D99|nr:ADP-ribosylglycohydrolase family protein [Paenarthrobacter sp. Z7-10]MCZ2404132.1 ADP-ribosylglycohydrolase family protein [Paenarthrobacter sp. Z7-10]
MESAAALPAITGPGLDSRVHGCLMGGALGDTFGYSVQNDDGDAIRARFGSAGLLDLSQSQGPQHFSACTQLTLYTVDALVEALEWANDGVAADERACLWLAYLRWLATQQQPVPAHAPVPAPRRIDGQDVLHHRRHPDPACLSSLSTGEMGTVARPVDPAADGSGAVVRSAPFGLIPHIDAEAIHRLSTDAAALTHGHPAAQQSAAVFSWLIHELAIEAKGLREAAESARLRAGAAGAAESALTRGLDAAIELGAAGPLDAGELAVRLGSGQDAVGALTAGLYAVLATEAASTSAVDHFLRAMRVAVNQDGDSSSAGSIAGNILGAFYGEDCLPQAWLALSETPGLIRTVAQSLLRVTGSTN